MSKPPIKLFYSYADKDESLLKEMDKHLSMLKRDGIISEWYNRRISAGQERKDEIDKHLDEADIVLLLVSADFIASDYSYSVEMTKALEKHKVEEGRVIPVILRPVDWKSTPFSKLQVLPKDGKPVINWDNRDDAWLDVAKGIRQACNEINSTLDKKDFLRKGFSIEKQPATIYHVAWSQDCRYLATGDDDHKIKIWDTNPEKLDSHLEEFRIAELVDVLEGHERRVKGLAWSPDDRRLASASADKKVLIWDIDWDVEEKQKPLKLMGHFDEVNCVAWASENRLLSGSDDNDVVCWNPKTGDRLFKFNHDHQRVLCLALSADVTLLATGAPDGIVRVWDWQARRCIYNLGPLSPHGGEIYSIAWANNKILASGSEDKKVVIWNLDNINEPRVLEGHNDRVLAISFSHNQKLLASQSADDTLRFWNVEKARPIDFFRFECSRRTDTGMTFDQKRPYLVSLGKQDHVFRTWEVAIDEMIQASLRRTPEDNTEWNKQEKALISSTAVDEYREIAKHACEAAGHYPLLFRTQGDDHSRDMITICDLVKECDFYIGIYAQPDDMIFGKHEYSFALEFDKKCYIFISNETASQNSDPTQKLFMNFKKKLRSKHRIFDFSDKEDFSNKIYDVLNRRFQEKRGAIQSAVSTQ